MGEAAAAIGPEVAMFGGEAAASGIALGAEAGGILGTGISFGEVASGLSIGSLALSGAGSIMGGEATASQKQMESQNYLYSGAAKALNYRAEGEARATNYEYDATTKAANYTYAGETESLQREMEASGLSVQAVRARRAADFGRLQAGLTDVAMREDLAKTLGGIETTLAARHTDIFSPTGAAFEEHQRVLGSRQRQAALLTIKSQIDEDEAGAAYYDAAAKFALGQGARAKEFAAYNADVAMKMGTYNADVVRYLGETNAATALKSAGLSSTAANAAGDAAIVGGDISGIAKILGGLGKAAA